MDRIIKLPLLRFFILLVSISFLNTLACMNYKNLKLEKELKQIEMIAQETKKLRMQLYDKNEIKELVHIERKKGLMWLGMSTLSFLSGIAVWGNVIGYDFFKSVSWDSLSLSKKAFVISSFIGGSWMYVQSIRKILTEEDDIKLEIENKIEMNEKITVTKPPIRIRGFDMFFYSTLSK
jgi:hypothetical protein